MHTIRLLGLLLAVVLPCMAAAQEPTRAELKTVDGTSLHYVVRVPTGYTPDKWVPVLVVFTSGRGENRAFHAVEFAGSAVDVGFVVVAPVLEEGQDVPDLRPLFTELRRAIRIDQGAMHALLKDDGVDAEKALRAHLHPFQTVSFVKWSSWQDKGHPPRRFSMVGNDPSRLGGQLTALHGSRVVRGQASEVSRALDEFHDAAANGDEERYFAILPHDAIFLGTDGTERWTGRQFREKYGEYFERASAWTYVPLRREVKIDASGPIALFDESFDHETLGECRGSGVMVKQHERWVLRQYHLTVPVPNDVTNDVVARIRSFHDGISPVTTIVLVRHAEKADASEDPDLSESGKRRAEALAHVLQDVRFQEVYTSQYRRTVATVAELVKSRFGPAVRWPAADVAGLVARLCSDHRGRSALVCGHSDTIPAIIEALGVEERVRIADDEYDQMFVVTIAPEGVRLQRLRYGKATPHAEAGR